MNLILFDLDGTLITTDHAGMRAFRQALSDVYGIDPGRVEAGGVRPDGKTDPLILKEILEQYRPGEAQSGTLRTKMFARYLDCLEKEMLRAKESGRIRILPGVGEFLEKLDAEPDSAVGLATGNLEQGARIKLECAGIYHYFHFGGFGSDSENRTVLTRIGIRRGMQYVLPEPVDGIFVIGDTPLDIEHGHAAGAAVIAVAGGAYSVDDLSACNPDLVLPDLNQPEFILSFMRSRAKSAVRNQESGSSLIPDS
jgi:phosphoglycolate phosphatase